MQNIIRGLSLLIAAALVACGSSQADWNQAMSQNTVDAYQAFLTKHPSDAHGTEARSRIQTLQDAKAWMTAQTTNTVDAYQQYIAAVPNGAHVLDAHNRITAFQQAAAYQDARNAGTASALQAFLEKYPSGLEADQARAQLALFDYEVQLGAYRSSQQADHARTRLQDKYGKDLQSVVVVPPKGKSRSYHVASAAMTQDQARSACTALRKSGQRCEVTKRPEQSPAQG